MPEAAKGRTSTAITPNLFWGKPEYLLGIANKGTPEQRKKQHQTFRQLIFNLGDIDDAGLIAVRGYLEMDFLFSGVLRIVAIAKSIGIFLGSESA